MITGRAGEGKTTLTFAILGLHARGRRRFELAIIALLGFVVAGLLYETLRIGPSAHGSLGGLLPGPGGGGSLYLAGGIFGAAVMPHVIYLHSALTEGSTPCRDDGERSRVLRFGRLDVLIALGLAGLVNMAVLAVAAPGLAYPRAVWPGHHRPGPRRAWQARRRRRRTRVRCRLLSSGASSSSVGAYAGQVVMTRFVSLRVPLAGPARDHHDPRADHPGDGHRPRRRPGTQPGRAVLGHPVRSA